MNKKTEHLIVLNAEPARGREYSFLLTIGKSKRCVRIRLAKDKLSVCCLLTSRVEPKDSVSAWSQTLAKGIKAALILHILLYGQELRCREVYWRIGDGGLHPWPVADPQNVVFSLLHARPRKLNPAWREKRIAQNVLEQYSEDKDYRFAALSSYLMAKSCFYETERFMYLWMSMNGLYRYYNGAVLNNSDYSEARPMKRFMRLYTDQVGWLDDSDRRACEKELSTLIFKYKSGFMTGIKDPLSETSREVKEIICRTAKKTYVIDAYWLYLLQLSYTLRCDRFHAAHPLKMLSFAEESEVVVLRTVNDLIEEFLDANLHKWFDEEYLAAVIRPRARGERPPILPLSSE